MTNGSSYLEIYLRISSYIRRPFLIYDFATASEFPYIVYEENLIFFFISVQYTEEEEVGRGRNHSTNQKEKSKRKEKVLEPKEENNELKTASRK